MGQLLVRNLDDEIIEKLRQRAERSGRSVEAEHRELLRQALDADLFWQMAARLRDETAGRDATPAEALQREGRDER